MFDETEKAKSEAKASLFPYLSKEPPPSIFDTLPFPVFVADKRGRIIYRNRAAVCHIGPMRRGCHIKKYLLGPPSKSGIVQFTAPAAYVRAMAIPLNESCLYLAFGRLQLPDAEQIAPQLQEKAQREDARLLALLQKTAVPRRRVRGCRIYTELFRRFPSMPKHISEHYSLAALSEQIFPYLEGAFSALGYRITVQEEQAFQRQYPICMSQCEFLYLFELLLYTAMKSGVDGRVAITLGSDNIDACHLLTFSARASACPSPQTTAASFLEETVPELAAELLLLGIAGLIDEHVSISYTESGILEIQLTMPYLASSLALQSPALAEISPQMLESLAARLRALLKENSAFCQGFPSED